MDVGALKQKISEDKEKSTSSYRRYPVRFLFMEMNNNTQDEIEDLVKSFDGELLELSDFIMKKDDGWMTKSRFVQIIKSHVSPTKDTFVVGFSELIRFFSKKRLNLRYCLFLTLKTAILRILKVRREESILFASLW